MAYRTATFDGEAYAASARISTGSGRRLLRALGVQITLGLGAVATVGAVGATVTVAAIWFVGSAGMTNPHVQTQITGPGRLALAGNDLKGGFETTWKLSQASRQANGRPLIVAVPESTPAQVVAAVKIAPVEVATLEPMAPVVAKAIPVPAPVVAVAPIVPLPLVRPAVPVAVAPPHHELARAPVEQPAAQPAQKPAVQLASLAPATVPAAIEKRGAPQASLNPMGTLPDSVSRTAVYDIANATVYLPNGQKLEAHSGMYDKMDDPRHTRVRMRGATPPNVYVLTERESLFHGVRAIRLNPVDSGKMYGRDGILAHTYMLGPTGQSNGCVSFKNYDKFLEAFLDGKVDKLVVVGDLGNSSWRTAALQADGVTVPARRMASNGGRSRSSSRISLPAIFGGSDRDSDDGQTLGYAQKGIFDSAR